jgi:hypothetical protein
MNKERLLNVAKALRESPNPAAFSMEQIYSCGSPCCALGHYAARPDLQQTFTINRDQWGFRLLTQEPTAWLKFDGDEVCEHFGISEQQARQLFRDSNSDDTEDSYLPCGCGGAQTAIEAAEYIQRFVAENS